MTLQNIIVPMFDNESGVKLNRKGYLIPDSAFVQLFNAYVFRGKIKKREGLKLIGRLRRVLSTASIGLSDASIWSFNLYTVYGIVPETNAQIQLGSVVVKIQNGPDIVFTDQGNGLLTSPTMGNIGWINYVNGNILITTTAPGGVATTATFNYFPSLPVMGISQRERAGINDEQTIFFDTKYVYFNNGLDFQEFLPSVTWDGTDSDFFWTTNYRGSEASKRLFFTTNFVCDAGSPMRYTDASTWTTFNPILSGTPAEETSGTVTTPWLIFNGVIAGIANLIKGSLVITVGALVFRDTPEDGILVSSGENTGSINYTTGAFQLNFDPALTVDTTVEASYSVPNTRLFSARILIPYYGRLIALNVFEGVDVGAAATNNIFNRARFSQVGDPTQADAWRSDVFGKGGFVDAPVNEEIISARYYKNVLIVQFEKSTWRLQYIGEYGTPFIWERISSDWGADSTFSTVLFDEGVLAIGDKAIVTSSGNEVQRIDLDIPDTVYSFKNSDNGTKRVQGIREFQKELVYWCYNDYSNTELADQYFPNTTLVYNYRNNTFAFFRNNTTAFGNFQYPTGITWDRLDIFWDDFDVLWDSSIQALYPTIASGNQQGFCHFFCDPNADVLAESQIDANDEESLAVSNVQIISGVVTLTVINHNLSTNEWIYLAGLVFTIASPPSVGSTTLNDQIYLIAVVDINTIQLFLWDITTQQPYSNFTVKNVGEYVGGGVIALLPILDIQTKEFNPVSDQGQNLQTSYIDFLMDATPNTQVNVNLRMNTSFNANANMLVGNTQLELSNTLFGDITLATQSNPCIITSQNHSLLDGDRILIQRILGMTQLNNNQYNITFIDVNSFSLNVDSTGFSPYVSSGQWIQVSDSFYTLGSQYAWYRFFANSYGQFLQLQLTYSQQQMSELSTHQSDFVWEAMKIWFRPAGNNIFGK